MYVAIAVHFVTDAYHSFTGRGLQNKCSQVVLVSSLLCVGGEELAL